MLYFFKSFELVLARKGTGSTFDAIRTDDLARLDIPLPPAHLQQFIITQLDEQMVGFERVHAAAESELETINRLPAALLRRAFDGKL